MKRIGILTAGGDTPALNAAIHGAVVRANQLKIEIYGLIKGFNCLFNPRVPHVHLNPLFQGIPELDPTKGGTLIGSSRDYLDPSKLDDLDLIISRLKRLGIEGLISVGGDGTLNGLQPLAERLPTVLAPETIVWCNMDEHRGDSMSRRSGLLAFILAAGLSVAPGVVAQSGRAAITLAVDATEA